MAKNDDKTEDPTPKKRRDARRDGQIAKSQEFASWAQILVIAVMAPVLLGGAADAITDSLNNASRAIKEPTVPAALSFFGDSLKAATIALLPLLGTMLAVVLIASFAQTRGAMSKKLLKPKFDRLNPFKGLKRLASPMSLWEAGKVVLKTAVLAAVALPTVQGTVEKFAAVGFIDLSDSMALAAEATLLTVRNTAIAALLLGGIDFAIQRRRITKGMKMTKQEVKDEAKQSEGDPLVKQQIRSRQMAMGRNRMLAAVPDASVVVVNPTHIAVAIRYKEGDAPRVVAKGKGHLALKIRELAEEAGVPIVRNVPLARTLEKTVKVGNPIPPDLYEAVARLLAFVFHVAKHRRMSSSVLVMPGAAA